MAYSESQKKATLKYRKAHYSTIVVDVRKEKKAAYMALAASRGMSLSALIVSLLESAPAPPE